MLPNKEAMFKYFTGQTITPIGMLIPPPPNVIKNPHPLLELAGTQFI
jgi:hypothetical protein